MKKLLVIFVSLILLMSSIGVGAILGCAIPEFYVTSNTTHMGEYITVVAVNFSGGGCINPSCIEILNEDCSTVSDKAILVTSKCEGDKLTVTYRAVKQGTVKFRYISCTQTVTIMPKPYPMLSFMKILGLGKAE